MTDLLVIDVGKIEIRNPDGSLRFSSVEPLFHPTDKKSGQVNITWPFVSAGSVYDRDVSYDLGAVHPKATHVFAYMRVSADDLGRMQPDTWYDASGTFIHRMSWVSDTTPGVDINPAFGIIHSVRYTFVVSSGRLILREEVHIDQYETSGFQSSVPYFLTPVTIYYKAKVGLFV